MFPGLARETVFVKYPAPEEDGNGARVERDSGCSGASAGSAGSGPITSNPRAGSCLELAGVQGCEDLQLAANILMVGWSFA